MAIFAQVRYKSIKASVIHRKLDLSASLIPELGNQIYFSKLVGVANWQNLYLHDVHVNAERTIYLLDDAYAFLDSAVFVVDKGLSDSFGFSSQAAFTVGKQLTDTTSLSDLARFDAGKAASDDFSFLDGVAFGVNAERQSSFTTLDQLTVTRQPYNFVFSQSGDVVTVTGEPDDSFTFADGINSFSVSKSLQDFFALDDFAQINKDVEGVKSNVFGLTESLEASFGKVIESELFTVTEQASFSVSKPFADSTSITEALGLHPSRLSTDETTLSDVTTLSSSAVKTDSAPITDALESNVGKIIENQLFSLTDQALFALSKPVADSIMVQELLTSHASKSATDTTALNDAATLSPWIGKSDSTSIVDSLDVEHVVTGALLNQAMIGNIILNAD
jgi:hypothetical protein